MPMHVVTLALGAIAGLLFGYLWGAKKSDALRLALDHAESDLIRLQRRVDDLERGWVQPSVIDRSDP